MKYCKNCGSEMSEAANICKECGFDLENAHQSDPENEETKPKGRIWKIIFIALLLALVSKACGALMANRVAQSASFYAATIPSTVVLEMNV